MTVQMEGNCVDARRSGPLTTRIAPWRLARRGAAAVEYCKAAFDAADLHRVSNDAGKIVARLVKPSAEEIVEGGVR